MSRPKFCVGELVVAIRYRDGSEVLPVEIEQRKWCLKEDFQLRGKLSYVSSYTGWAYFCSHQGKCGWYLEPNLRKLPPQQRTQWKDCAWQPKKEGVPA